MTTHFALLSIKNEKFNRSKLQSYIEKHRDDYLFFDTYLFGVNYVELFESDKHLSASHYGTYIDNFNEWFVICDNFMKKICYKFPEYQFIVYVVKNDGSNIDQITYEHNKQKLINEINIKIIDDDRIIMMPNIDTFTIKNNISSYFDNDYPF